MGGTEEKYKNPFKTDCKYDITLQEVPQIHLCKRNSVSIETECSKLTNTVWPSHCVPIFEIFHSWGYDRFPSEIAPLVVPM